MSKTCFFLQVFLFNCFNQVAKDFTFTSEISVIVHLLKCLPWNATKCEKCEIRTRKSLFDGIRIRRNVQLGHFILFSVTFF